MASVELRIVIDETEVGDASADIQELLDLDKELFDLSPSFRRILFDIEDGIADVYVKAASARARARRLGGEALALRAQAGQAVARARQHLARATHNLARATAQRRPE
ncbi:MAG TPA: hypothetical protein VFA19_13095 [Gaiellaceae bacterium]|nr:hypothetical protein [Gaiellaceae bacterium]